MTATPARSRSIVIFGVMPRPPAEFSPFTMTKSTPRSCLYRFTLSVTALRPGSPTMSPRNKMRNMLGPLPIRWKMSPKLLLSCALAFWAAVAGAQELSPLAPKPNWAELEPYQQTITREEFTRLLADVYAPNDAARDLIEIGPDAAQIKTSLNPPATWMLRFAGTAAEAKPAPRFWKLPAELGPAPEGRPLAGVKVALDPGHLGGKWAQMEQRYFQIGESRPVTEGDLTLRVAKMLVPRLQAL